LIKKEADLLAKLKPIQGELKGIHEKLSELRVNYETNEKNKDFLYSFAHQIVQELKGPLEMRRQLEPAQRNP